MTRWSRPCYDKPRRCPGWAGGGWMYARVTTCPEETENSPWVTYMSGKPRGYLPIDYESRWWNWKIHTCPDCGVKVLPYMVRWTSWRSWWYSIRFARNSWLWLMRLENWTRKKLGIGWKGV